VRSDTRKIKEKSLFSKQLAKFRDSLPTASKNSTAQNWHKAAQKIAARSRIDPL
jgi:hypothetical protein